MKTCSIDPDHSVATFAVRHLMIAYVRGMLHRIRGVINYNDQDITRSTVEAEIEVSSLTTGVRKRDEHLLSSEILDAARYPLMRFRSTWVEQRADRSLIVHGDLTIHGITKPAAFDVEHFGPVKSPWGGEIAIGFSCSATINREDFGVNWGSDPLEGGGIMTGREVQVTLDLEADLPAEQT